jgi:hypothetical protein
MKPVHQTLAIAASGLLLVGVVGCAEDNEKAVRTDSAATKAADTTPAQYGKRNLDMGQPQAGYDSFPKKAGAPKGAAGGGAPAEGEKKE